LRQLFGESRGDNSERTAGQIKMCSKAHRLFAVFVALENRITNHLIWTKNRLDYGMLAADRPERRVAFAIIYGDAGLLLRNTDLRAFGKKK